MVFSPEVIEIMSTALEQSVGTLPEPVSTDHVHRIAGAILRAAEAGERNVAVLQCVALMELRLTADA